MKPIHKNKILATIALVIFVDNLGGGMIVPLLPSLFSDSSTGLVGQASVATQSFYFGLSYMLFPLMALFSNPYLGYLSDFVGRRYVIVGGMVGFILTNLLTIFAIFGRNLWLFLLARLLLGLFGGTYSAASAALMDLGLDEDEKVKHLKLVTLTSILGFIVGPSLSSWVSDGTKAGSLVVPFAIVFVLSIVNFGLILVFLPQSESKEKNVARPQVLKMLSSSFLYVMTTPAVLRVGVPYFLFQLGYNFYFQSLAGNLQQIHGLSISQTGQFFFVMGLSYVIGMYWIHPVMDRFFKVRAVTNISLVISSLLIFALCFEAALSILWLLNIIFFMIVPLASINLLRTVVAINMDTQGLLVGVTGQMNSFALIVSSLLISILHLRVGQYEIMVTSLILAIVFILNLKKINKEKCEL